MHFGLNINMVLAPRSEINQHLHQIFVEQLSQTNQHENLVIFHRTRAMITISLQWMHLALNSLTN